MKIRLKFVSNSSSSSFMCEVCGRTEGEFELSYEDAEMVSCTNGHCVCKEHLLCDEEKFVELYEENDDLYYDFPSEYCPVCQGKELSMFDLRSYAKKNGLDKEIMNMISEMGYKRFREGLKK